MTTPITTSSLTIEEQSELQQHEATIERGLQTFYEVGTALIAIRDGRLYRVTFGTFEAYCQERWSMASRHAFRLMEAAQVVENVTNWSQTLPKPENESQVRPLVQLEPEEQREVWKQVVDTAPKGNITAAHVQRTADDYEFQKRGSISRLKRAAEREERKERQEQKIQYELQQPSPEVREWQRLPESGGLMRELSKIEFWLNDIQRAAGIGKLSPEAKQFLAHRMQKLATRFSEIAESLNKTNG